MFADSNGDICAEETQECAELGALYTLQEDLDAEAWLEVSAARLAALLDVENAVMTDMVD